ncbi:MAG: SRPBCC family protein [Polyangiales bacterium]
MTASTPFPFNVAEVLAADAPLMKIVLGADGQPRGAHAAVVVRATPARTWAIVSDVARFSQRVPMIDRVSRVDDIVSMELKFKIALFSVGFRARMKATIDEGRSVSLQYLDGEPRDIEIRFDLVPTDDGETIFHVYNGFDVLSLGFVTKWFLKHHPEIRFGIVPGSALALAQVLREASEASGT